MKIRRAEYNDIPRMINLLNQVLTIHHEGRPDLFKGNCTKYTEDELRQILKREDRLILAAVDEQDSMIGYAFCELHVHPEDNILTDIKTLYIDDLCMDEMVRGHGVGTALYQEVLKQAKELGCYNVTLNVWTCNEAAMHFYENCGLRPQKIGMETILS